MEWKDIQHDWQGYRVINSIKLKQSLGFSLTKINVRLLI